MIWEYFSGFVTTMDAEMGKLNYLVDLMDWVADDQAMVDRSKCP
ncbi:MAG: hypothetical protein AAF939_01595 [Planctomycetota bacterium]